MRELKFRGKTIWEHEDWQKGSWIYGGVSTTINKEKQIIPCIHYTKDGLYSSVDPSTIGQYIEQKDKNGKEIYEGDILIVSQPPTEVKGVVKQDEYGAWVFGLGFKVKDFEDHCEVKGNIHDNQ